MEAATNGMSLNTRNRNFDSPDLRDASPGSSRSNSPEPTKAPITAQTCPELPLTQLLRKWSDHQILNPELASKITNLQTSYEKTANRGGYDEMSPAPAGLLWPTQEKPTSSPAPYPISQGQPEPNFAGPIQGLQMDFQNMSFPIQRPASKQDDQRPASRQPGSQPEPNFAGPIQGLQTEFQNMSFPIQRPTSKPDGQRPSSRGTSAFKIGANETLQSARTASHTTAATLSHDDGTQQTTPTDSQVLPGRRMSETQAETMPVLPRRRSLDSQVDSLDHFSKPRGRMRCFLPLIDTTAMTARRREIEKKAKYDNKAASYQGLDEIKPSLGNAEQRRRISKLAMQNAQDVHQINVANSMTSTDAHDDIQGGISKSLLARRRNSENTMMAVEISMGQSAAWNKMGAKENNSPSRSEVSGRRRSTGEINNSGPNPTVLNDLDQYFA